MGVHGSAILEAFGRVSRAAPVLWVTLSIRPLGRVLAVEREASLSLVVGKLYSELAAGWESNGIAVLGWIVETAQGLLPFMC